MTNAEKLAKDIEQLTDIINGIKPSCDYCIHNYTNACDSIENWSTGCCFEGVQKWLKEEVKD